jgi:hypothetical protein
LESQLAASTNAFHLSEKGVNVIIVCVFHLTCQTNHGSWQLHKALLTIINPLSRKEKSEKKRNKPKKERK